MWKKENDGGPQSTPSVTMYTEAMNKFTKSATAFMDQVHLLTEARDAYQEAMEVSAALRKSLDAGDQTLRSLMTQLEQVVSTHLSEPVPDKKRPEPAKVDAPPRVNSENTVGVRAVFP
jgi:exonuclease VII small subunit